MAYQRREGLAGGGITKYADNNLRCCPFCGSNQPHWLTDAYIANYSLIASNCVNGYKFQCEKCGGELEIQGNTDFCFQNEMFVSVKLLSVGNGHKNGDKLNMPLTIQQLKVLCQEDGGQYGQPQYTAPQYGQPQYTAPQYGQPQYTAPPYGQPQYTAPQYGAPTPSNNRPAAFNIFSLLSLIFSFFALIFSDMAAIIGEYDEESMIVFLVFSLMLNIPAFIFQFIARKKKSFVLWKIFSWVAFGICILTFLIIFLSLAML